MEEFVLLESKNIFVFLSGIFKFLPKPVIKNIQMKGILPWWFNLISRSTIFR